MCLFELSVTPYQNKRVIRNLLSKPANTTVIIILLSLVKFRLAVPTFPSPLLVRSRPFLYLLYILHDGRDEKAPRETYLGYLRWHIASKTMWYHLFSLGHMLGRPPGNSERIERLFIRVYL